MDENMLKLIDSLEKGRLALKKLFTSLIIWASSLLLVAILFFVLQIVLPATSIPVYIIIGAIALIASIVLFVIAFVKKNSFKNRVINGLTNEVNKKLFPDAVCFPAKGLKVETILKPGFFGSPDRYLDSGYMGASYKGIHFEKGHYELQKRHTHTDSKGNTVVTYETYAKGTMFHFLFERDFKQTVKVMEKGGGFFFNTSGLSKIETEYISFNKKFQILASDEQTVFYILTPQIQEKIMDLETRFKGRFFMAFIGSELFIAIDDGDASFEISITKPFTEESLTPIVNRIAIPAVFINLLGLDGNKYKKDAGVTGTEK